ncbi:unnamed protein product [Timema podura]|uniref:Uncharacterized protein n=1 Tax=Timema podura TaxID=61482 RepID=A0ABN7PEX2_TIMPD|nr:unnamed protein product [Timema podura]
MKTLGYEDVQRNSNFVWKS